MDTKFIIGFVIFIFGLAFLLGYLLEKKRYNKKTVTFNYFYGYFKGCLLIEVGIIGFYSAFYSYKRWQYLK